MDDSNLETKKLQQNTTVADSDELKLESHSKLAHRSIQSLSQLQSETSQLLENATRTVQIYTRDLDPRILNQRDIEHTLIQFIKNSRSSRIQILVYDENQLRGKDHRLVSLAQRFTSFVEIRLIPKDYHENHFSFYLIDQNELIYRNNFERYQAEYAKLPYFLVKEKSKWFDSVWQMSPQASFLRALHL